MTSILLVLIYFAFIGLGLPDSLLGAAWPTMVNDLQVSVSYAGVISFIIALGTVISSLCSDMLIRKFKTGVVTAVSTGIMALALFGFSISGSFTALCLWAIPYGLGAGSIDAALNNYVAIHYASRHMSWLHCMWGLGASLGSYIIAYALTNGSSWTHGYRIISLIQLILTVLLFMGLPLWKKDVSAEKEESEKHLNLWQVIKLPGVKEAALSFTFYSGVEQTAMLWAATYLTLAKGLSATNAAAFESLFFIGITTGRILSGFITLKFNDTKMTYLGFGILIISILMLCLPGPLWLTYAGIVGVGLGCAPIYPSMIHSIPSHFGTELSQSVVGVIMASAYIGTCCLPPLFGVLANHISAALFPVYLLVMLLAMAYLFTRYVKKTEDK